MLPLRYIALSILLLCSLQGNAQRMIPWYEPDFDSVYRQCFFVYGESFYIPHYYHFWSKTAKKHRLKSIVTYSKHTGTMRYRGVHIAKYDTAGYLEALEWYAYNVSRLHRDTFIMWRQKIGHVTDRDGLNVVVDEWGRDHGDTSSHKAVYHFNNEHQLESDDASQSDTYHYDTLGRLLSIKGHVKNNGNRSVDSFSYSPFVREADEDTDSSDQLVYRRMKGIWPENILSFILDSSNGHNRYLMMWKSVTHIGNDTYPDIRGYEVLATKKMNFVKRMRFKDGDEESAGFAQVENNTMVMYSTYSFMGKGGLEYLTAKRTPKKWQVVESILGERQRYKLPLAELPKRRRFPDHIDRIRYAYQ